MRPSLSDHFDGARFVSAGPDTDRTFADMLRWLSANQRSKWPKHRDNEGFPFPDPAAPPGAIAATFVGQSTFVLTAAGRTVLTDPIFSDRAGPFGTIGPKRVRAPGIAFDSLPRIDIVLLSHNHYDHMDVPSLLRLRDHGDPAIVTGLRNGAYLRQRGIRNTVELDWWQSIEPVAGFRVTYVPAQHWSRRGLTDRRRMLWGGHVVETPAGRIYFAGDTGYGRHFAEIRQRFGPPDLSLLPIGAYEPRWFMAAQHMNPDDAVRAHLDLQARFSIAMHFGTFQLTDEDIDAPAQALATARTAHGVAPEAFALPGFGQTLWAP